MFEQRLKMLIRLFALLGAVLVVRLAFLQLVDADTYLAKTQADLQRGGHFLETVRGSIYDCRGRLLAVDRPTFDLCLHYRFTRLYDDRFWEYQRLRLASGEPLTLDKARKYLRRHFDLSLTKRELAALTNASPQDDAADNQEPLDLDDLRPLVMSRADALLADLATACPRDRHEFTDAIVRINDRVWLLRTARARRIYYDNHPGLTYESRRGNAILDDMAQVVPDDAERLRLVGKVRILEMNQAHRALLDIDKEAALTVEERFVGAGLVGGRARPVNIATGQARHYPYGPAACHVLGQVRPCLPHELTEQGDMDNPTEDDLQAYRIGDRRGDWGIERLFELLLRGRRGWQRHDIEGEILQRFDPLCGDDVILTLDIHLQSTIQARLDAENHLGAVVVIDVPTGMIRALVSKPTFDLNSYYDADNYRVINQETPDLYKRNRALEINYQPGSTIKPTMILGAMQLGLLGPNTRIECLIANKWWTGPPSDLRNYGPIDAAEAIMVSSNFFLIRTGALLGPQQAVNWLRQCGFGRRILAWPDDVQGRAGVFGATVGHVAPIGRDLPSPSQLRFMSIGRGALDGSVLHIANAMANIARGGYFLAPTLVAHPECVQEHRDLLLTPAQLAAVEHGMHAVVAHMRGTACEAFQPMPWADGEVMIYGKTGSTDYSIFACFARARDGRCLAVAALVEEEKHGSEVAAPLVRDVLLSCGDLGYLPPCDLSADEIAN